MSSCKDERMWAFQGGDSNVLQFQGSFANVCPYVCLSVCLTIHQSA